MGERHPLRRVHPQSHTGRGVRLQSVVVVSPACRVYMRTNMEDTQLWPVDRRCGPTDAPVAGRGRLDLRPGQEVLSALQGHAGYASHALRNPGGADGSVTRFGIERAAQHGVYRAGKSDRAAERSSLGAPYMVNGPDDTVVTGAPGVVARVVPLRPPACVVAGGPGPAA